MPIITWPVRHQQKLADSSYEQKDFVQMSLPQISCDRFNEQRHLDLDLDLDLGVAYK